MNVEKGEIKLIIRQISDVLLINGGFLNNPGLYFGEMGLVLFFAKYARYTGNDLHLDYTYSLIEKIQNSLHMATPINYKQGLTGIGSAIEYMVQNGFIEADTDEVLEEFDEKIFYTYNLQYLSIDEIKDVGYYAAWRINGASVKKDPIKQTIIPQIEKNMHERSVVPQWRQSEKKTIQKCFAEKTYDRCLELIAKNEFWTKDMGLQNGLAGWGISILTELDGDNSWLLLLPDELKYYQR